MVVPDFGGFITHRVAAHYDEADRLFIPPYRTLGFNPQLRMNDSVLAQSYVEAYDISYPEALRRIEDEVTELRQQLSEQGSYVLDDLGTLTINNDGNYEFSPCEAGILSPDLYGLGDFYFKRLKDEDDITVPQASMLEVAAATTVTPEVSEEETTAQPSLLEFTDTEDDHDRTIVIKMSWIRNAVAIAAAIAAFFFITTPVTNSDLDSQAMTQIQGNVLYKLMPQDTNMAPEEPIFSSEETVAAEQPAKVNETPAVKTEAPKVIAEAPKTAETPKPVVKEVAKPAVTYCVIVASQVKRSNAELFVERLHQQGYSEARIMVYNDIIRVSCGEYQTEAEAYRQVNKLNRQEELAEAWVFKKR